MLATTSNLVGVVGPTSDAGTATAPIINRGKVTMFSDSGERTFDHSHYTYFWRIVPPDEDAGLAMALWAHKKGYTRVAAVFGNDISEQGNVPALIHGFEHLGGTISIDQQVALDASSYRSEVERMLASHPQAIFTEMDPQSAATYFSELHQLHPMLPVIGTAGTEGPSWWKAVSQAIGRQNMVKYYVGVQPYVPTGTAAWRIYHASLMAVAGKIQNAAQYIPDPYAMAVYDSVNIMALAMTAAHSTDPTVYNSFVPKVVAHSPGAVVVDSYQAGKKALAEGKTIDYVGTTGQIQFDPWHNSPGAFEVNSINPANFNDVPLVTSFSAAQIAALAKASGL
jgi:ABC-type branched-subunit amino acid transport system substrate-binding protein